MSQAIAEQSHPKQTSRPAKYDAFMSYSHAADGKLAPALESSLERFAKPWFRRRVLRLFRDQTSLAATPHLWPSIEEALSDSRFFLLLASPQAAQSEWVQQEVAWWLEHRSPDSLIVVLTNGELLWSRLANDFDWTRTDSVPSILSGRFENEPLWVDVRWANAETQLSSKNPGFQDAMASLAAPLRGMEKEDLIGEDVRQFRRTRRIALAAIATLATLLTIATVVAVIAVIQRSNAIHQRRVAQTRAMVAEAPLQHARDQDERAALLAYQAYLFNDRYDLSLDSEVGEALRATVDQPFFSHILTGHDGRITSVAFNPKRNLLASSSDDRLIVIWDLSSPGAAPIKLQGHENQINSVAFSPDGNLLASAAYDMTVRIWSMDQLDGPSMSLSGLPAKNGFRSVAFSPDGRWLAAGSNNHHVWLWDLSNPAELPIQLEGHEGNVVAVAFSPDGSLLASGGDDGRLYTWNHREPLPYPNANKSSTRRLIAENIGEIRAIAFRPDGTSIASGGMDDVARLWTLETGNHQEFRGHDEDIETLSFTPDGKTLITGSRDETIRLWDADNPNTTPIVLGGSEEWVWGLAISSDGDWLASASAGGAVRVWDLGELGSERRVLRGHGNWVWTLATSRDGSTLVSGSEDGTVKRWDLDDRTVARTIDKVGGRVFAVALSPDGRWLAIGGQDGVVRMLDLSDPDSDPVPISAAIEAADSDTVAIRSLAFSADADGRFLASGSDDGTVRLWRTENLGTEPRQLSTGGYAVKAVAFSPDGSYLAAGADNGSIYLWDPNEPDRAPAQLEGHQGAVLALAFDPDSQLLASGGVDSNINVWTVRDPDAKPRVLRGHEDDIRSLAFNPLDGNMLASGSNDQTIRLWYLDHPDWNPAVLGGQEEWVRAIAFLPNGRTFAASSADGTIRLWTAHREDLADDVCGIVWRNLTPEEWDRYVPFDPTDEPACPDVGKALPSPEADE